MPEKSSPVREFYEGKNILITGATGFLGIGLVEKLLRSCNVGTIYLLMRAKKGKDISTRLEELKKNLIFEKLREKEGDTPFKKLVAMAGDVGEDNLGLTPADRKILTKNVEVVFHSAATLDFEAGLKQTVSVNLLGTRRIIILCSEMEKLQVLVYVSSAYANSNLDKPAEEFYDPPGDVLNIMNMTETLPESVLEELTPSVLGDHPNTYTMTKQMAEHLISSRISKYPSAIVRPSMIVAAWKEPVPGWTISKNGPQGFIMGASKGVVRRLPVKKDLVYDYIPVDIVVNTLISAGWRAGNSGPRTTLIFHSTSSTTRPFTWLQVEDKINYTLTKYPLKSAVWYPTMKLLPSLTLFRISAIIFHFIPGFFLDLLMRVGGGRPILMRLHTNVNRSLGRLAPFIFREWFFDNSHTMALYKSLSETDKELFNLDISTLDWVEFFTNLVTGVRRYLHNEEMKTLPAARRKNQIFFIMNFLLQVALFIGIWYLISVICGSKMSSVIWIIPLIYALYSSI